MVGLVVIKNILVSAVPEDFVPFGGTKVRQLVRIGGHGRKPIVEYNMELGSDGAGLEVEDQGNCRSMLSACANENLSLGPGVPTWHLLSICNGLV